MRIVWGVVIVTGLLLVVLLHVRTHTQVNEVSANGIFSFHYLEFYSRFTFKRHVSLSLEWGTIYRRYIITIY
jgi:hypothetical protein